MRPQRKTDARDAVSNCRAAAGLIRCKLLVVGVLVRNRDSTITPVINFRGTDMKNLKYEIVDIEHVEITVDVSLLTKSDDLFFNATEIARQFKKRPDDFWKQKQNTEYLEALITLYGGNKENYVFTKAGRMYGGTWLHKDLALQFARWLSPIFAVKLDKWTAHRINEEHQRRLSRLEAKTGFLPMTTAIQSSHSEPKRHHFSNECDMLNRLVTGMTSKQFKAAHGVDSVRDALSAAQLQLMERLQRQNTSLIELGFSYDDRKRYLSESLENQLAA